MTTRDRDHRHGRNGRHHGPHKSLWRLWRPWRFFLLFLVPAACAAPRSRIVLPPEAAREWAYTPSGDAPRRHVIRMSDGSRDWEVEFPDVATGYEVRIPLKGNPEDVRPTAAASPLT